ncbi:MAG: SDR family oxidoreductase [Pseudomonadota bacterium]
MGSERDTPVALIVGAGDFLGAAIARRFAREGYHVVATRRRGDLDGLKSDIEAAGGRATALHSDARDEEQVVRLVGQVESDIGPIEACIYNIGANVSFPITETTSRVYRKVWEMSAFGAFLVGREVARCMLERGRGTIIFTGASASVRGKSGFAAFSGAKQAKRALAQSMARELGPQGVHVAHIIVDGAIDNDHTRERFPEWFETRPEDGIMQPDHLAENFWNIHVQPRSAWTFELDLRPYVEPW